MIAISSQARGLVKHDCESLRAQLITMAAEDCKTLRALMASRSKDFIQVLMLRVIPDCVVAPHGTKATLINRVIDCVKHNVQQMYPPTLSFFTKDAIDHMLPRKGKTKRQSIEMVISLDQPSNVDQPAADAANMMLVPLVEEENMVIVPFQKKNETAIGQTMGCSRET